MKLVGHLINGYCLGYDWYGNYIICGFQEMRINPEELENLPIEDYAGFGFARVEGLVVFVRDIIEAEGKEYVSVERRVKRFGKVPPKALTLISQTEPALVQ